ncbi:MOSC domain-containing protein [Saccharothrix yanglingensis]|uniref:MOSC domain-containing protein n=1 Tax=Saccharothrix yanglingensis TaxID=659496 RepID=A0ABU0X305_9PSEU|nr:MOSC N-terminal beta barrel domain-containing protein [Saccharothrix yanglingensis]MDQ2586493.1 MOSC domain-containing protein [Saccharothrix yanglingensis]
MHVEALWRYPVKSLGGERITAAELTDDGVAGDRLVHVSGGHTPLTGRTRHGLLTIPASTGPDGTPLVAGHRWDGPEAGALVEPFGGRLARYPGPERFDVLNLLVATDGAVRAWGSDVRRLRPNLLIGGVDPDAERDWPGHALLVGDAVVGVFSLRARCVVTSIDPDSGERHPDVFRRIRTDFGGRLALNCWVIRPGRVREGDTAELVPTDELPDHVGGWITGAPYALPG